MSRRTPFRSQAHQEAWMALPYAHRRIVNGQRIAMIRRGDELRAIPVNDLEQVEAEHLAAQGRQAR